MLRVVASVPAFEPRRLAMRPHLGIARGPVRELLNNIERTIMKDTTPTNTNETRPGLDYGQAQRLEPFLNRVTWADCLQALRQLPDESVDLVLTDPPYLVRYRDHRGRCFYPNDDHDRWVRPAFAEMFRVLKRDAFCISFYGWPRAEIFFAAWRDGGFRPVGHFAFLKPYASRVGFVRARHDQAVLLAKGRPALPQVPLDDVIAHRWTSHRIHPAQRPVSALTPLIRAFSKVNDIVLDPFGGSGTTAVAALQCDRRFILFEMKREYYESACARINRLQPTDGHL